MISIKQKIKWLEGRQKQIEAMRGLGNSNAEFDRVQYSKCIVELVEAYKHALAKGIVSLHQQVMAATKGRKIMYMPYVSCNDATEFLIIKLTVDTTDLRNSGGAANVSSALVAEDIAKDLQVVQQNRFKNLLQYIKFISSYQASQPKAADLFNSHISSSSAGR